MLEIPLSNARFVLAKKVDVSVVASYSAVLASTIVLAA